MPTKDVNSKIIQQNSKIVERALEPRQLTNCRLWIDGQFVYGKRTANPANGTALGASGSTDLKDLSSSGLSLTQSTLASRPLFQSADKSILFDGANDVLDTGSNTFGKNVSVLEAIVYCRINTLLFFGATQRGIIVIPNNSGVGRMNIITAPVTAGQYHVGVRCTRLDSDSIFEIAVPFNDIANYNLFHFKLNHNTSVGTIRINNSITNFALPFGTGSTSNTNNISNVGIGGQITVPSGNPFSGNIKHLSYYEGSTELTQREIQSIRTGILSRNQ